MGEVISFDLIAHDLASKAFKDAGGAADGFRGKLALVGGVASGAVGAGLTHMGEKLEETRASLKTAIADTGASFSEFSRQIDASVKHEEHFGHTSSDTNEALAVLTRATGDTKTALADMDLVTEIAAVHHSSLADAANQVAKMHGGATKALKEFGINAKGFTDATKVAAEAQKAEAQTGEALLKAKQHLNDVVDLQHSKAKLTEADHIRLRDAQLAVQLAEKKHADATAAVTRAHQTNNQTLNFASEKAMILAKIHGTAAAQADTFGGHIKELQAKFTDYAAELGTHVGPALTVLGPALGGIGMIIDSAVVPAILSATAAALPWIAGIAAVAAAAYLLYRNWDTIWSAIKTATAAAVDFVKDHLVLILTVALGPIGFAIGELATHWDTVWGGVQTAVQDMWKVVEPIFGFLKRAIDDIAGPLEKVAGGAGKLISGAGSVLSHIPGFADGGYIPGDVGQPRLAVVHGGELVLNPAQQRAGFGGTAGPLIGHFEQHVHTKDDPGRIAVSVNQGLRDAAFLMGI